MKKAKDPSPQARKKAPKWLRLCIIRYYIWRQGVIFADSPSLMLVPLPYNPSGVYGIEAKQYINYILQRQWHPLAQIMFLEKEDWGERLKTLKQQGLPIEPKTLKQYVSLSRYM